jgi:hypothetical protein
MELPSWFQSAMERRLDYVSARIEQHTELQPFRAEEEKAWEALLGGEDRTQTPEFRDWEDKHHYRRALENERLYLQGMRDGAQLVVALLTDPLQTWEQELPEDNKEATAGPEEEACG